CLCFPHCEMCESDLPRTIRRPRSSSQSTPCRITSLPISSEGEICWPILVFCIDTKLSPRRSPSSCQHRNSAWLTSCKGCLHCSSDCFTAVAQRRHSPPRRQPNLTSSSRHS